MKSIPKAIIQPRGLLGQLAKHVYANSFIPNKFTSYASALGFLSMLVGSKYQTPDGVSGGLYIALIGATGSGKDIAFTSVPDMVNDLVTIYGERDSTLKDLYHCTIAKASSKEGIEDTLKALKNRPNLLIQLDELGRFTQDHVRGRSEKAKALATMLTEQYGKNRYIGRKLADKGSGALKSVVVERMSMSCIAGTNMESLKNGIMMENVYDGFLNRFLFMDIDQLPEDSIKGLIKKPLSAKMCRKLVKITKFSLKAFPFRIVDYSDQADELYYVRDNEIRKEETGGMDRAFRIRTVLHAKKIALLIAISEDYMNPMITGKIAKQSLRIAEYSSSTMIRLIKDNIVDSSTERVLEELFKLVTPFIKENSAVMTAMLHKNKSYREAAQLRRKDYVSLLCERYDLQVVDVDLGKAGPKPKILINGVTDINNINTLYKLTSQQKIEKITAAPREI